MLVVIYVVKCYVYQKDKRNIIIGTTGLCGCVGLGIICETNDKKSNYLSFHIYYLVHHIKKLTNTSIIY